MSTHPLASSQGVKARLEAFHLTPNKALGQNFLASQNALDSIVTAADVANRPVLEIGSGLGTLTEALLARAARVVAIEKDAAMVQVVEACMASPQLQLVHADVLKVHLESLFSPDEGPVCVVGNLPYYVTTPIVMRLLQAKLPIASMTLMVQQEAAERFYASPGARVYGPLSILAQSFYDVQTVCELSPDCFYPQPDVRSCVVRLVKKRVEYPLDARAFASFLTRAFSMRRKTLLNNLSSVRGVLSRALQESGQSVSVRAEALTPEQLMALAAALKEL